MRARVAGIEDEDESEEESEDEPSRRPGKRGVLACKRILLCYL